MHVLSPCFSLAVDGMLNKNTTVEVTDEPRPEKTGFLPMLRSYCEAYQCLYFHYTDSTILLLSKFEIANF